MSNKPGAYIVYQPNTGNHWECRTLGTAVDLLKTIPYAFTEEGACTIYIRYDHHAKSLRELARVKHEYER